MAVADRGANAVIDSLASLFGCDFVQPLLQPSIPRKLPCAGTSNDIGANRGESDIRGRVQRFIFSFFVKQTNQRLEHRWILRYASGLELDRLNESVGGIESSVQVQGLIGRPLDQGLLRRWRAPVGVGRGRAQSRVPHLRRRIG